MSEISADVRDIVAELDADGGGYQVAEAAGLLVHRLSHDRNRFTQ